tara:strand:- start:7105 stop:7872 length:768 start_codon:yes stop_codon:yes gene_type:complete
MNINYLKNKNKHVNDDNITFKEEGHEYTVNGNKGYTSVTTWIHSLFDTFDADKIIQNMMNSSSWPKNKYYGMSKNEIKQQWDKNRDESSSAGTKLHYDIECKYNKNTVVNDSIEYSYFLKFYHDYTHLEPYRTEMLVYYEELKLAGSIDMIFRRDDQTLEIYDWKRTKEIVKTNKWNKWIKSEYIDYIPDTNYWHYALQLNTYKYILIKKYGMQVGNLYLVVLHPNNKSYLRIPIADLQNEVDILFKERSEKLKN